MSRFYVLGSCTKKLDERLTEEIKETSVKNELFRTFQTKYTKRIDTEERTEREVREKM